MKEKLHYIQIICLMHMLQLDVTNFALPRYVAKNVGTNGWIAILIVALVALLHLLLLYAVYHFGKGRSLFAILEATLPRFTLIPLYIAMVIFFVFLASMIGKNYTLLYQTFAFQNTKSMVFYTLIVVMAYFLLSKGIYNIVKAVTIFFLLSIWMTVIAFYYIPEIELVRFTPFIFKDSSASLSLTGWAEIFVAFMGYELVLFLFPAVNQKTHLFRGAIIGHLISTAVVLLTIFTTIGFFGNHALKAISYPVLDIFSYVEIPFISRIESIIYPFFTFSNVTSVVMYSYAALLALGRIFPKLQYKALCAIITILLFVTGFIPTLLRQVETLLHAGFYIEMIFAFTLPFLLLIFIVIQRWAGGSASNAS